MKRWCEGVRGVDAVLDVEVKGLLGRPTEEERVTLVSSLSDETVNNDGGTVERKFTKFNLP